MAAIYAADIFCDDCADDIKRTIAKQLLDGDDQSGMADFAVCIKQKGCTTIEEVVEYLDWVDERDYDSDEYPKYCSDDAESDSPQHCGSHDDCLNYGELADGFRYGYCFGNSLTSEGEDYVKEAVRDGDDDGIARLVWAEEYSYLDFDTGDDYDDEDDCEG